MDDSNDLFSRLEKSTPEAARSSSRRADPIVQAARRTAPPKDGSEGYNASHIEVLKGLEPVRRRPGMYIGGTDSKAMHHLFAEVIDNSMDEAVAGHATFIDVELAADGFLTVTDNGRGIPVDEHPEVKGKSALEVIMTTLHAGGKFGKDDGNNAYETSGGLHGVGISVVNALSELCEVEVARGRQLYRQRYARGLPLGPVEQLGEVHNRRGTRTRFKPDLQIFGKGAAFEPARIYRMARSKAYLFGGVEIRWSCDPSLIKDKDETPAQATFHFPGGLKDYLAASLGDEFQVTREMFAGKSEKQSGHGSMEWAVTWFGGDGFVNSYCNTIPTHDGGTHETGFRNALTRGLRAYAELAGNKRASIVTSEDVMISAAGMLSVFIREPEFVGQTKDKLATVEAQRLVENALRDPFDHWLADNPQEASKLLEWVIARADERVKRRQEKEISRKSAVRKLRLPGKLADCTQNAAAGAEIFIVEGDSAGGSAKQARDRAKQAVLPLRGKILNVASAGHDKLTANQQIADLIQALGCGTRSKYRDEDLRYDRVIIMTDADVDGAHIASLLITFFFQEMPALIKGGHLYLAVPPLYRISQGGKVRYARDDEHKDELLKSEFTGRGKVDIGRFKGLGEMMAAELKATTMDPKQRRLLRVEVLVEEAETKASVDSLMGTKPEARFRFIQERAEFAAAEDWISEAGAAAIWKILKALLIAAVAAYALVVALAYFAQRALLYPGATKAVDALPATVPWGVRVAIATADGETLAALHVPPSKGRPTVLFFPGNGDNIVSYGFLGDWLSARGYGLLALSYRGYPGSTGSPSEAGLLADGLAAFDWLSARDQSSPIVILGRSLGTGVAVNTAAERDAAAVVLISAYESILAVARNRYPYLPVSPLMKDSFRSDLRIARVSEPKLFLHGDLDSSIPLISGKALFDLAPEPRTFSVQHGHGHNDIWTPAMVEEVIAFADSVAASAPRN